MVLEKARLNWKGDDRLVKLMEVKDDLRCRDLGDAGAEGEDGAWPGEEEGVPSLRDLASLSRLM